ncbi:MAG: hypothetical protein R2839_11595 [Thermomicrobiales bacterium]
MVIRFLVISGEGDVIEPDDGSWHRHGSAVCDFSCQGVAEDDRTFDARAIVEASMRIAAEICIFTNDRIETVQSGSGRERIPGPCRYRCRPRQVSQEDEAHGRTCTGMIASNQANAVVLTKGINRSVSRI